MADLVLQQLALPTRSRSPDLYFRRRAAAFDPRCAALTLPPRAILKTNTYFNAFFEDYWRTYTRLQALQLCARLSGTGRLRLWRRGRDGGREILAEAPFRGSECLLSLAVPPPAGEAGLLYFEVRSGDNAATLHRADWVAGDVQARSVRLAIGYCTFERERQLLRNVRALVNDRSLAGLVERIIVVDQGLRKVRDHFAYARLAARAGRRLVLVEQENFGGAGGFTRSIREALGEETFTHMLLTDDDAEIDAESVRRAGMFLGLARDELAVGGQLLDRRQSTRLIDVGATYEPARVAVAPSVHCKVGRTRGLHRLQPAKQNRCNGWWFFAFPLRAIDRVGLPLPLFLRGDDVEFGCRLAAASVPTVPLPGVAVRHEAIDQSRRGWQVYYDMRNMLAVGALHFTLSRRAVLKRFLGGLLGELLAYRYAQAWLLCEAAESYLGGPALLRTPPAQAHRSLVAGWQAMAPERVAAAGARPDAPIPRSHSRIRRIIGILRQVTRNLLLPEPPIAAAVSRVVAARDSDWHNMRGADVVTVIEPGGKQATVLRRSRFQFLRLGWRGSRLSLRLLWRHRRIIRAWRDGAADLTSAGFWQAYLNDSSQPRCESTAAMSGVPTGEKLPAHHS